MYRKLAKLLNVPFAEEFIFADCPKFTYMILDDGVYRRTATSKRIKINPRFLDKALDDGRRIIKYWKPIQDENYYVPDLNADFDTIYANGLVCHTKKEAEELYDKLVSYAKYLRGLE